MQALAVVFLFTLAQPGAPLPTETWPQWRGPTGDSVAPGTGFVTSWSATENVIWKAELPGWGASVPAIWKDTIFVTTQEGQRLLVLNLDRKTANIVWQREVGKGTPRRTGPVGNNRYKDEHNMASPSPVTDGRHVWVHFGTGELACFDFAGEKKWQTNLAERFGPYTIWWGHANSPVVVGDVIVSVCMQDPKNGGQSYIVGHDKLTGEEKWHAKRMTGAKEEPADSYTTPVVYTHDGKAEVIVFGGNVLDAYDPITGKLLWQCTEFKGNRVISGPTLLGDTVFATEGMRGPVFAVKAGLNAGDSGARVRWTYKGNTPDAATPVAANGLLFLASNDGFAICLEASTGKEIWKERIGTAFRASPLYAGGNIYFLSQEGRTTVVAASRDFRIVGHGELGEQTVASPAVAYGDLFVRTNKHLYRIGKK
ncbi:MAG: serine/threonine protein kinase [Acidobacteria bacterium]|nr:MAG: serine/threonine protein kinase [Acidobacteriota bacterium]